MFAAFIPNTDRRVLRIAITRTWEPRRIPTPRFIDAWTANEDEGKDNVPVLLALDCENVVVLKSSGISDRQRSDLYLEEGELNFCRIFAKSGSGREEIEPQEYLDDDVDDNVDEDDMSS
jgi:hypothetical protein